MPKKQEEPRFKKIELKNSKESEENIEDAVEELEEIIEDTEFHTFIQPSQSWSTVLQKVEDLPPQDFQSIEEIAQTSPTPEKKKEEGIKYDAESPRDYDVFQQSELVQEKNPSMLAKSQRIDIARAGVQREEIERDLRFDANLVGPKGETDSERYIAKAERFERKEGLPFERDSTDDYHFR